MSKEHGEEQNQAQREPMPVFSPGERIKESVYAVGDITLFRPMSLLEIFVGMPLCALFCTLAIYPLTNFTWAISSFLVLVYFSPKALVWLEAQAGRPLAAELAACTTFAWDKLMGQTLYQGMQRLSRRDHPHQRRRLKAMLEAERRAHAGLLAESKRRRT